MKGDFGYDPYVTVFIDYKSNKHTNDITYISYGGKVLSKAAIIYEKINDKNNKYADELNAWLADTGIAKEQLIKWIQPTLDKKITEAREEDRFEE